MSTPKELHNPRLELYVQGLAKGLPSKQAALAAGYTESYAAVAGKRLGKLPQVQAALQSLRAEVVTSIAYDLAQALKDCDTAVAFAIERKVPMAVVKAYELKAKLSGLLIDRVEAVTVNLKGALELARARVRRAVDSRHDDEADSSAGVNESDIPDPQGTA